MLVKVLVYLIWTPLLVPLSLALLLQATILGERLRADVEGQLRWTVVSDRLVDGQAVAALVRGMLSLSGGIVEVAMCGFPEGERGEPEDGAESDPDRRSISLGEFCDLCFAGDTDLPEALWVVNA